MKRVERNYKRKGKNATALSFDLIYWGGIVSKLAICMGIKWKNYMQKQGVNPD